MRIRTFIALTIGCLAATLALAAPAPKYDLSQAANQRFLADNAHKKGAIKLPDGLQYRVIWGPTIWSPFSTRAGSSTARCSIRASPPPSSPPVV